LFFADKDWLSAQDIRKTTGTFLVFWFFVRSHCWFSIVQTKLIKIYGMLVLFLFLLIELVNKSSKKMQQKKAEKKAVKMQEKKTVKKAVK
jgi:hypothetical protein